MIQSAPPSPNAAHECHRTQNVSAPQALKATKIPFDAVQQPIARILLDAIGPAQPSKLIAGALLKTAQDACTFRLKGTPSVRSLG